ncbi:MAG TPA: hypothetical protein VIM11_23115 [Tepidisphaeraceae bacterium]
MITGWKKMTSLSLLSLAPLVGCHSDRPHAYGQQRQPVDELNSDDTGLQSKDVVGAADKVARDFLASPALNASRTAWTIVVSNMEDKTTDQVARVNFDIFLQALKGDLAQKSNGRIQLIANKAEFNQLRSKELEGNNNDQFGQSGAGRPTPKAINPDFALTGTAMDLPNRATNFYQIEFRLDNLQDRTIAFVHLYQVKVAR